jgi:acetyltransferase
MEKNLTLINPDAAVRDARQLEQILFHPSGIVVVGASQDPAKLGYALARNLVDSAYPGSLHFVNPRGGSLFGRPIYTEIAEVPDPVDLAVLLIPAPAVPQALRQCGQRGISAAIVASGGFREMGAEGARLEQDCLQAAQETGLRLVGPNCVGLIDTHLPVNATFLAPPGAAAGDLALLSQSGAFCAVVIDWSRGQGLGFSRLVSLGNQADLNESDFLELVAADPATQVITMYLEGIGNGKQFLQAASRAARQKPVLALKVGRSASGIKAAASHTGSLAGQDAVYDAAFQLCGVIRANTTEELFEWARALAWCPPARGNATAVLTNAGGPGVTAADALDANGMRLSELTPETRQRLRGLLPPAASILNPVDLLASATPEQFAGCLRLLIADSNVDTIMVILVPPPLFMPSAIFAPMIPIIQHSPKPVVSVLMGGQQVQQAVQELRQARIPEYSFPERAASALAALVKRGEFLQRPPSKPPALDAIDQNCVEELLSKVKLDQGGWLSALDAQAVLNAYGISTLPQIVAASLRQARRFASELGMGQGASLALKIASPDILHKSDIGGVLLNIATQAQLERGFKELMQRAKSAHPHAQIQGVMLQLMAPAGQEVILGTVQDAEFGSLVMFGSGGVEVEGLKDIAFGLSPLSEMEANAMIDATWAGRKLAGFRSVKAADRGAVVDALLRVARLAADFPQLSEIEINPLRVLSAGALALDVRMKLLR